MLLHCLGMGIAPHPGRASWKTRRQPVPQHQHMQVDGVVRSHMTALACAQVDDLVLLHGVDEQTGVYLEAPWNLARVSAVVPRVPKWS